jgi:hypothetical protein
VSFAAPEDKEHVVLAATLDISATGIGLLTKEPLKAGQELTLRVDLPTGETPTVGAEVIRVEKMQQLGQLGGINEYKIGLKLSGPVHPDESVFVKYYAEKLRDVFGKQ